MPSFMKVSLCLTTEPRHVLNDLGCTVFRKFTDYFIHLWGAPAENLFNAIVIKRRVNEKLVLDTDGEE